jgi:hypothetical protein
LQVDEALATSNVANFPSAAFAAERQLVGWLSPTTTMRFLRWLLFLAALLVGLGSIRIARENTTGMLLVAALVLGLAILDWRQAH